MRIRWAVPLLAFSALAGCTYPARLATGYVPTRAALRPAPLDAALAVHRFADERPPRLYSTQGRSLLAMVPLVPWASMPFERIDETVRLQSERGATPTAPDFEQYAYPASFARAVADDLGAGYRYVLDGTLLETPLVHAKTCYFLGLPGCYIDFLGVPSIKTTAQVRLRLTLRDTATGAVLWSDTVEGTASRILNDAYSTPILYGPSIFSFVVPVPPAGWPVDDRSVFAFHFEALRRAMAAARPKIAAAVAS
jgi:hypothetical protein